MRWNCLRNWIRRDCYQPDNVKIRFFIIWNKALGITCADISTLSTSSHPVYLMQVTQPSHYHPACPGGFVGWDKSTRFRRTTGLTVEFICFNWDHVGPSHPPAIELQCCNRKQLWCQRRCFWILLNQIKHHPEVKRQLTDIQLMLNKEMKSCSACDEPKFWVSVAPRVERVVQ